MCLKGIKIDVSGEEYSKIIVDDVSCISRKAVRGLHTALRQKWTSRLLDASQGKIIKGLALQPSKDIATLTSCRTNLSFEDWHYLHRSRLGLLPVRARPGSKSTVKTCRLGCNKMETSQHVISACQVNLNLCTARHNSLLDLMAAETRKLGHVARINLATTGDSLRPDLIVTSMDPALVIDVTVPYDDPLNLQRAHDFKVEKYQHLGRVLPLVVGATGAWLPSNDEIAPALGIDPRTWNSIRRRLRLAAIQGTTKIISRHLAYGGPSQGIEEEDSTSI